MLRPYHRVMVSLPVPCGWLLVSVSTAGAPASLRVHPWRRLRGLGALYLQQSVCLLQVTKTTEREIARLVDKVHRGGGRPTACTCGPATTPRRLPWSRRCTPPRMGSTRTFSPQRGDPSRCRYVASQGRMNLLAGPPHTAHGPGAPEDLGTRCCWETLVDEEGWRGADRPRGA